MTDRQRDLAIIRMLGPIGPAFFGRFCQLTGAQRAAIPAILRGNDVLLCSSTASGKTEAIIAPVLARLRAEGALRGKGVRFLILSPTRALVNDLHARISGPLAALGLACGRQTSDHREKHRGHQVLVTTPESLDSMLVRDGNWQEGRLARHLLDGVRAVFLDEAHLFEDSARGDQTAWLLERLSRLVARSSNHGGGARAPVQYVGGSATIAEGDRLALRLFGRPAEVVRVQGAREMDYLDATPGRPASWLPLESAATPQSLYPAIPQIRGNNIEEMVASIWMAIQAGATDGCRKALVFVPTRRLCDQLSAEAAAILKRRRRLYVGGHHGSLSRSTREEAERAFGMARDAVLVATTTLEVGIDIGDVDVVVLIGPAADVSGFLQRVGRSGRRTGKARVVPVARDPLEARALASLMCAAVRGDLDARTPGRRWSVAVQQAGSIVAQRQARGCSRSAVVETGRAVWGDADASRVEHILQRMVECGELVERRNRLFLGEELSDGLHGRGLPFHSNFGGDARGLAVVDAVTGSVLARVAKRPASRRVALAGGHYEVISQSGELVVRRLAEADRSAAFVYPARRAPMMWAYARHVRAGFGFDHSTAPVLPTVSGFVWCHFAGAALELCFRTLFADVLGSVLYSGLCLVGRAPDPDRREAAGSKAVLRDALRAQGPVLANIVDTGIHFGRLPPHLETDALLELIDLTAMADWLRTVKCPVLDPNEEAAHALYRAFRIPVLRKEMIDP